MHASRRRFLSASLFTVGSVAVALRAYAQAPTTPPAQAPAAPVTPYAPPAPAAATLKDTFKKAFHVGVAITPNQISGQTPKAAEMILREFDSISPENIMKMGPIHPRPGNDDSSYEFAPVDAYVDFGVKNHLFVIGHNLCWHSQMPNWMSQPEAGQTELTKEILGQRLKDHILKVAGRYKGKINGWDVVNEALADNPGQAGDMPFGLRADSPWNRVFRSPEYILMAFKWAHEADPNAELYYNDYNLDAVDTSDYKRANAIALLKYLKENGAPITGVGMQGHYNMEGPSIGKIDETIGMFEALGLTVQITELDVRANAGANGAALTGAVAGGGQPPARGGGGGAPVGAAPAPLTAAEQQALAKRYGQIFEVFLKHKGVARVTFWGLHDGVSWRRANSPLLFDAEYGRKPAYDAVIAAAKKAGL